MRSLDDFELSPMNQIVHIPRQDICMGSKDPTIVTNRDPDGCPVSQGKCL